jgi:hypothetical protein
MAAEQRQLVRLERSSEVGNPGSSLEGRRPSQRALPGNCRSARNRCSAYCSSRHSAFLADR